MNHKFNPSSIRIILIVLIAALLLGLSTQTRLVLAAENPDPPMSSLDHIGIYSKEAIRYRDIQIVGQVIALLAGMCFVLLAVAPFILFRDQDQRCESDKCHFSNKPE